MLEISPLRALKDPFNSNEAPLRPQQSVCLITTTSSYEAGVIRLLLGTVDICDLNGTTVVAQRLNYFVLGLRNHGGRSIRGVQDALRAVGLGSKQVDGHLRLTLSHQDYFREVLLELVEYFARTASQNHTMAFIHLYRFLERISFALPLLFAMRSTNYVGAFTSLKQYFQGGVESELSLLKKLQENAIDSTLRDAGTKLEFGHLPADEASKAYNVVRRFLAHDEILSVSVNDNIEVKSGALLGLLITLRNRYFHFSVSNSTNIATSEIYDVDSFFEIVNRPLMNWLAVIFLNILVQRIK